MPCHICLHTLYRSIDGGKTWADQMEALKHLHARKFTDHVGGAALTAITSIVKNDHAIVFLGEEGMHVISRDAGKTYVPLWHPQKRMSSSCTRPSCTCCWPRR